MTNLRKRMLEEFQRRNYSEKTIRGYLLPGSNRGHLSYLDDQLVLDIKGTLSVDGDHIGGWTVEKTSDRLSSG